MIKTLSISILKVRRVILIVHNYTLILAYQNIFQIPRYIITLHELLAHTPHDHVERSSLDYAKAKLEELSKVGAFNIVYSKDQ